MNANTPNARAPYVAAVVVDTDTGEVLTRPMSRGEAESVVRRGGTRRVHVEAVTIGGGTVVARWRV